RNQVVILGLHDQDVATKLQACSKCPVLPGRHEAAAIAGQVLTVQLALGSIPLFVPIERWHSQRQPPNGSKGREYRRKIGAVAGAYDRNRLGVDSRMAVQAVVGRQEIS